MESVSIAGLKGLQYQDKTQDGVPFLEEDRENVTLSGWTDRVYLKSGNEHVIEGVNGGKILFKKENLPDTVVWNPWEKKAGEMGDLGSENWKGFVCVEALKMFKHECGSVGHTIGGHGPQDQGDLDEQIENKKKKKVCAIL